MASQLKTDNDNNNNNNNKTDDDVSNSIESMRQLLTEKMEMIFVGQLTIKHYRELQNVIYNFCVKGKEVMVFTRNREFHDPNTDGTIQLCQHIDQFLNDYLKKISKSTPETDEECLDYYYKQWQTFQVKCNMLNNACKYLNDQQHRKNPTSKTVKEIALHTWSEHLFKSLNAKVSNAALRMLDRNREGELINSSAIRAIVESYLELGSLDNTDEFQDDAQLTVYALFEQRILDGTQEYYSKDSEKAMQQFYIDEKSFVAYLKHVQSSLHDEMKRATLLHPTTKTALMRVCCDSLITKHEDVFDAEFNMCLTADKKEEMELICSLAVHSETVIKRLNKIFEDYVLQQGLDEIEKCANETIKDPKKYIDTIIALYEKFRNIVDNQLKNELGFLAALDKACASFINRNRLTIKTDNPNKSAEFLATYCHILLKKSNRSMEEAELDRKLNQMMIVFRFIEDKDVFEGFYKKLLADRLIYESSASDDNENSMISKLKQALGYDYTNKLQRMYQDIQVSKDLSKKFREKRVVDIDFSIKVLSNISWPLKQTVKFNLPAELNNPIDRFTDFYRIQHHSRKLMWLHRWSQAEVVMKGMRSKYFIKMNTLQLTILLQFNERPTFTVQQLQENTNIELNYLKQMIETSMIRSKILKHSDQSNLTETTVIEFNTEFKEPKIRFDITIKLSSERKAEQNEEFRRIDDDRKAKIEAAIVRIMKMRKVLSHQNLVGEVLTQLSKQFKPKVPAVKKCIDLLIEKEYLERKEGQKDIYQYLA